MPPSQTQYFGPPVTTLSGQTQQANFLYSQCSGKKKALIIGINYIGTDRELGGCINDANRIKEFIMRECTQSSLELSAYVDRRDVRIQEREYSYSYG